MMKLLPVGNSDMGLCWLQISGAMAASVSLEEDQAKQKQKQRIEASKLYFDVPPDEKASFVAITIFHHPI